MENNNNTEAQELAAQEIKKLSEKTGTITMVQGIEIASKHNLLGDESFLRALSAFVGRSIGIDKNIEDK